MSKAVIHPSVAGTPRDWATTSSAGSRASRAASSLFDRLRQSGRGLAAPPIRQLAAACLLLVGSRTALAGDAPAEIALDGARLRLVAEAPSASGEVRAALLVDLEPGWKTYWLDPGDAGLPPRLDLSASVGLTSPVARFPLPHRASDAYGSSNVYSQPFAVALSLQRTKSQGPQTREPAAIDLRMIFGLCRDICIPASAHLSLDIARAASSDAALVAYAFDALPEPSGESAGIQSARLSEDGRSIEVEALSGSDRANASADLFLAGPEGWYFGMPEAPRREGRRLTFRVPVAGRPRSAGSAPPAFVDAGLSLGARAFRAEALPVAGPD